MFRRFTCGLTIAAFLALASGALQFAHHEGHDADHASHQCDVCFKLTTASQALPPVPVIPVAAAEPQGPIDAPAVRTLAPTDDHSPIAARAPPIA